MKAALKIALILACAVSPALAQQKGDWVLAQWRGGAYWFPGVIQSVNGGSITVVYDDGTRETRPAGQVRQYDWRVGSRVECNWKNSEKWYSGRITKLRDSSLSILYDDNDAEDTSTGRCRSQ